MANTFLRSGNLDSVLALGENGQPVWHSALQIRETLRLRKQQALADLFAIPQPNEAGNRLDWYAPFSGKVTGWNSAGESQRAQALGLLEQYDAALREMSHAALSASKPGQKLFGALLAKALQFPDQNCVFLVGGKPVITFWGFSALNKKTANSLDLLRHSAQEVLPTILTKSDAPQPIPEITPAKTFAAPSAPLVEPSAPPKPAPEAIISPPEITLSPDDDDEPAAVYQRPIAARPVSSKVTPSQNISPSRPVAAAVSAAKPTPAGWLRYGWIVPGAVLLAVLGFQLRGCMSTQTAAPAASSQADAPARPAPQADITPAAPVSAPSPVVAPTPPASTASQPPSLPVTAASVAHNDTPVTASSADNEAPPAAPATTGTESATPAVAVAKDDLVLPENAVRLGSTRFLNGNWRAILDIKTPITGKPPVLRYQLKNGRGTACLLQGDGSSCRVEVYAGLMKSGNLVINTRTRAKCSDGARYAIPELTCTQGATGPAQCSARYDEKTAYPITIKREGK